VAAVPHGRIGDLDPAPVGTAAVILLAIIRQRLLVASERWISRRLASEMQERAQAMLSLARLEQPTRSKNTAESICGEAMRLESIGSACVYAFGPSGPWFRWPCAAPASPETVGQPISARRAPRIWARQRWSVGRPARGRHRAGRVGGRRSLRADALGRSRRRRSGVARPA
jgi:hypothetical protein